MKKFVYFIIALMVVCIGLNDYFIKGSIAGGGVPVMAAQPTFSNVTVHDPSVVKVEGTYYVFGSHLASAKSKDLMHWTQISTSSGKGNKLVPDPAGEFSEAFDWAQTETFWAPDVIQLEDGRFYMYYCNCGEVLPGGSWVGEDSEIPNTRGIKNDVVEALRKIEIPVLRWPGGCFADEYHWKDGIGPREERARIVNTHWGGVVENNYFGTHEFLNLCQLLDTEPYICGNVGSGTVYEMQQWIEYITHDGESPMADWRRENGKDEPWKLQSLLCL